MNLRKNFKGILAVSLIFVLSFAMLAGCGEKYDTENVPENVSEVINVAALNGPTGMGMVQLMDMTDKYAVTTYQSPTDAVAKLISGEVDVAALPSNMAAVLYNKTEGKVRAISPITLGVLHILGNDSQIDDVTELRGKTIVASGQGGTPEYVLQKVLESAGLKIYEDIQVEWLANHADVNARLLNQPGTIAMIPEPFVSTVLSVGKEDVAEIFDMNNLWKEATGKELPMGVLIATESFVEQRADDLKVLLSDLSDSVNFVNDNPQQASLLIAEKGFIGKAQIAEAAIPNCNIVIYTGDAADEGIDMIKTLNEILFDMNPKAIGGKIPGDDLYYGEKA